MESVHSLVVESDFNSSKTSEGTDKDEGGELGSTRRERILGERGT